MSRATSSRRICRSRRTTWRRIEGGRQVGEFRIRSFDYGVDFGRELGNWGEVRVGALHSRGSSHVTSAISALRNRLQCDRIFAALRLRQLDQRQFSAFRTGADRAAERRGQRWRRAGHRPVHDRLACGPFLGQEHRGCSGSRAAAPSAAADQRSHVLSARRLPEPVRCAGPVARGTAVRDRSIDLSAQGRQRRRGHSRRAGLCRHLVRGRQRLEQRRDISFGSTRKDASVFFGADTYIGPAYSRGGLRRERVDYAFYLFLGRSF
jgi:NTE family protein